MATVHPVKVSPAARTGEPLAARIAHSVVSMSMNDLPAEVTDKVKICLFDIIGCAFESRDLPWSRQAVALAEGTGGAATVIGSAHAASHADAAFANAVMGHGLVREDSAEAGAYTPLPRQLGLFGDGDSDPRHRATFGYRLLS